MKKVFFQSVLLAAAILGLGSCQEAPQVNILLPGQSVTRPNAVVAGFSSLKGIESVEWSQDGVPMGRMAGTGNEADPYSRHCFAAEVSPYAREVVVEVTGRKGSKTSYNVDLSGCLDVQAHRGGKGLMPENTIVAMENAVRLGVNTLELDLNMSSDGEVVVSHDRYFDWEITTRPDGSDMKRGEPREYLFQMPYDSIAKYDVGMKQFNIPACKPRAFDLIKDIEDLCAREDRSPMRYNIEVKSSAMEGEGVLWPDYKTLSDKCLEILRQFDLSDRLVIQCFDTRALNYMHEKYPGFRYSYLIETKGEPWESFMGKLDFKPDWLSPEDCLVDKAMVDRCHAEGIKIVPWNPDEPSEMLALIDMGIDALITNRPDRLLEITRR